MTQQPTRRALFPGSFNPFTRGHQSLVDRGLELFDEIVIAVGISLEKKNESKNDSGKAEGDGMSETEARMAEIAGLYRNNARVKVISYSGMTVNAAKEHGCRFILRGVRNGIDFEYERNMADVNRRISGVETILLFTLPEMSMISSSLVRELKHYGEDVGWLLPEQ